MSKLSPVNIFYLEHHLDTKTDVELATDLDLPLRAVRSAIKKIRASRVAASDATPAPAPASPHAVPFYQPTRGSVAMTAERSWADDNAGDDGGKRAREAFQKRYGKDVKVIDPDKPTN
jgi:hypothetical protein